MTEQAIRYTDRTADAIRKAEDFEMDLTTKKPDVINNYETNSYETLYKGMFNLQKVTDVETGSSHFEIGGGTAVINNKVFSVSGKSYVSSSHIYIESTWNESDGVPNAPTIKQGGFPTPADDKCNILLATIEDDKAIQQHYGAVYGYIIGECPEEEV